MNTEVIEAPAVAAQQASAGAVMTQHQQRGEIIGAGHRALTTPTPGDLLRIALESGADLDRLERLMDLQAKWEAGEARKAFVQAMTEFKAEPLTIFKRKEVGYTTKEGDFVGYKHATLSDVCDVVVPAMARHGLSHAWQIRQDNGRVIVSCTVTHRAGHCETVTMDAAPDSSGKKNAIQQIASATQYLQRYTLLAVSGMSTKDQNDDDGRATGDGDEPRTPEAEKFEAMLTAFREAAMQGSAALRKHYDKNPPGDDFWRLHNKALKAAAKMADEGGAQ